MEEQRKIVYVDDDKESVMTIFKLRAPSLFLGLVLGIGISLLTSRFEEVIATNIQVAYFLPFIVYMAAAVGEQTQAIYSRDLRSGKARFHTYLVKETILGIVLGSIFALIAGAVVCLWMKNNPLALSVGLSMFATTASAPLIALLVTEASQLLREDPAADGGPIATVIQDMTSVVIYGMVCTAILL